MSVWKFVLAPDSMTDIRRAVRKLRWSLLSEWTCKLQAGNHISISIFISISCSGLSMLWNGIAELAAAYPAWSATGGILIPHGVRLADDAQHLWHHSYAPLWYLLLCCDLTILDCFQWWGRPRDSIWSTPSVLECNIKIIVSYLIS
jgi:hypothetical protein